MMKRIFRGRLGRGRKGQKGSSGQIETAFVSQTQSSTEDLDEVDRLANHPVLRANTHDEWLLQHRLRKSRSETGGSVDRGLWTAANSNQSSPMGASTSGSGPMGDSTSGSGFGSRIVGAALLRSKRKSKKPISRMKRSYTVDFAAAQADDSPQQSLSQKRHTRDFTDFGDSPQEESPESPTAMHEIDDSDDLPVRRPSNHLVTAIIESSTNPMMQPRECVTPPPNLSLQVHRSPPTMTSLSATQIQDANNTQLSDHDDIITISETECRNIRHLHINLPATTTKVPETPRDSAVENRPPNSAPLPAKFASSTGFSGEKPNSAQPGLAPLVPHNLLRLQLQKKSALIDCDTSSAASTAASTAEVTSPPIMQNRKQHLNKLKLALPLKQRLQIMADSSQDDSSSSNDGTPHRRILHEEPRIQTSTVSKPSPTPAARTNVSSSRPKAPLLGRKMVSGVAGIAQKPPSKFILNMSGESESCSSAMSSLESVRSSEGSVASLVSSSESGAGMSSISSCQSNSNLSIPFHNKPKLELRTHRSNMILSSSKFQVLSPISDKSQEQSSEQGDSSSRTPKVSPTDHILASCCGVNSNNDDTENNNQEPAPFAMPKLQRRLAVQHQQKMKQQQQKNYQSSLLKKADAIQGSDSGISMSSQDVQDMVELLQLPFDMPKLRRKTQHILGRPQSMPTATSEENQAMAPVQRNTIIDRMSTASSAEVREAIVADFGNSNCSLTSEVDEEQIEVAEWPGPKPSDVTTGSTMDNFKFFRKSHDANTENDNKTSSGNSELPSHPAPPPGFADDNNQFYLTEEMDTLNINSAPVTDSIMRRPQNLSMRRRRTQMTLAFGVDPKQKTLMFTTEDPFHLNDCQDIDANLPLEKQEWYHGSITKNEAEESLRNQDEGSYLVRNVDLRRQEFSLIIKSAKGIMHMRIKRDASSRQFQLSDFSRTFLTIPDMVYHYTRNRLPIKGAEHMCLKKPVAIQLL